MCALVLSRLHYCKCLRGLPSCYARASLARSTCSRPSRERPEEVRSRDIGADRFHWLPIKQRVEYKLCCHVHNVSIGHSPVYMSDVLTACADIRSLSRLRMSSSGNYVIPRTRLKFGERAFAVSAPLAWNNLPHELKISKCTAILVNVSSKNFYSNRHIFKTECVMRLRSSVT